SIYDFHPEQLQAVIFHQGNADGVRHTIILDELRVDDAPASDTQVSLPTPENVRAIGYDRHIDVRWDSPNNAKLGRYLIYRSFDEKTYEPMETQGPGIILFSVSFGKSKVPLFKRVAAPNKQSRQSSMSAAASASTRILNDDELLTMLQEACFRYYWEGADPAS